MERISAILAKGSALSALDIADLQLAIIDLPADEAHEAEPWIWEGVALIVNDPDYEGDAKLPADA